mmetsp:Transcript_8890/g.21961  ORF Transcript_8890/g.21961 Transcript_8890/m.21961 type:complete len:213 (+) Transcript_8890:393-1031(+)
MPSKSRPGALENPGAEPRDSEPPPTGEVARPDQVGELGTGARDDAVAAQRALAETGAHNAQSAESGAQVDGRVPLANGGVPAEPGDAQPNPQLANMQLGQLQLGQMIASSMQAQNAFQVDWQASAQRQQTTSDQMVTALQHLGTLLSAPAPVHVPRKKKYPLAHETGLEKIPLGKDDRYNCPRPHFLGYEMAARSNSAGECREPSTYTNVRH